jgi:hypothetical protein
MYPNNLEKPAAPRLVRKDLNALKLASLTITEILHAPNLTMPPHVHSTASVCFTLSGHAFEIIKGSRYVMHSGCVIIRAPELKHANEYGPGLHRGFMIELENKWLDACRQFSSVFENPRLFAGGPVPALALRIYHESRIHDSLAPVIVEGLMLEMLGESAALADASPRSAARPVC